MSYTVFLPNSLSFSELKPLVQNVFPAVEVNNKEDQAGLEDAQGQVYELFLNHADQLIASFNKYSLSNMLAYNNLKHFLKNIPENNLSQQLRNTLKTIKGVASLLNGKEPTEIEQMTAKLHETNFFSSNTLNLSNLKLPQNLELFHTIPNEDIRYMIMAGVINRDQVSLLNLDLEKEEFIKLAPYLTHCDCLHFFDKWEEKDIEQFLEAVSKNVVTLIINSRVISKLPPLPKCEKLDCSDCYLLSELPALPNCKELVWINCPRTLYEKYGNLLPQHVLQSFHWSAIKDIENIRKIQNSNRGSDYYLQILGYLISRDKISIKDLEPHLERFEIIKMPRHLTFLDCKDAFKDWSLQEVRAFVYGCPWHILKGDEMQPMIDDHQKKLAPTLINFVENYLARSHLEHPKKRHHDFKSFLNYHVGNPVFDDLKELIEIIELELKAALPNTSFINIVTKLERLKKNSQDKRILAQVENSKIAISSHLKSACLDLKSYYHNTLTTITNQSLLPKNVVFQLLSAANNRLIDFQRASIELALESSIFDPSILEEMYTFSTGLIHSVFKMQDYLTAPNSIALKAESAIAKENMNHQSLDSRKLFGSQALRIPEKLQKRLSEMQINFDDIPYTETQLKSFADKRGPKVTSQKLNDIEIVTNEKIRKNFPLEYRDLIGTVSVTHLQGDRDEQQDTHLTTLLNVKFDNKTHKIPLYAIFDGHSGKDGSKFLEENLATFTEKKLNEVLSGVSATEIDNFEAAIFNSFKTLFYEITLKYKKEHSDHFLRGGSCATIAFIINKKLWVVNLGDTRAVLSVNGLPIALSLDASLATEAQKRTILKRGGFITNGRVNRNLNMSRSACEVFEPLNSRSQIVNIPLEFLPPGPKSLCIACDGVFDALSSTFVAHNLSKKLEDLSVDQVSRSFVETAYRKGSVDNLSALVLDLNSLIENTVSYKEQGEQKV